MTSLEQQGAQVWTLLRDSTIVGEICVTDGDFPWLSGRFVAHEPFEKVRDLFERELALVDQDPLNGEAWESVYQQIRDTLMLIQPDGTAAADFLLHIQDDKAWFRWSDEPFDAQAT